MVVKWGDGGRFNADCSTYSSGAPQLLRVRELGYCASPQISE